MTGDRLSSVTATIDSAIQEGQAHIRRMERAATILADVFPMTPESLRTLPEETVSVVDQFVYRFTKLQDSMATRLLPKIYAHLNADDSPRPFLDILASLEKLGILTSEEDWQFFRGLRNNLAHDYPESTAQTTETLNTLFARWKELRQMFETVREGYRRKT